MSNMSGSKVTGKCFTRALVAAMLAAAATGVAGTAGMASAALPMIGTDGPKLVDPAGKPVVLKGCNLGNLLILESWMFGNTLQLDGKPFKDQATLYAKMDERFGREKRDALMDVYRASYVTPRDFDVIKSFGFNVVRLPFDYRALQDDAKPTELRPDAFKNLDRILAMAEDAGLYVILDMHGVPGGQSKQDHTGQSDQKELWHDPAAQDRTVMLWKAIAGRYKDRSVVAAYDLINEPYADFRENVQSELAALLPRIAEAVRSTGDNHLMYFPGALNGGINFYGDPHATADGKGMTNIGFTEHYYPGLFGSKSALETHARLLGAELPLKAKYVEKIKAPYYVGEFNIVLASEDPNRLMRMYYDRFAEYGWAGTMWAYKLIKTDAGAAPGAWYMVTNADPLPTVDVSTASADQIESFFESLATTPLAVVEPLKTALKAATPAKVPLAKYEPLPQVAPTGPQSDPAGYTSLDIGGAAAGHTTATGDKVVVVGGGSDIFAAADSFRFVSTDKPAAGPFAVTITDFADSDQYAKAGVMARWGTAAGSPMVMCNVFPDGTLALISRQTENGPTEETKVVSGLPLPLQIKLSISGGRATATYATTGGPTPAKQAGSVAVPAGPFRMGLAVCSRTDQVLTTVKAVLGPASGNALPSPNALQHAVGPNLLANGSFEQAGDTPDSCAHWSRWGDWLNHEDSWSPTHDGKGLIGYHHWQIEKPGSSGLWQDVKVQPGKRYTFTVFAQHDPAGAGKKDAATVELRLEGVGPDGAVTLNTRDFAVAAMATGKDWSRLSVSGTSISDTVRVLAVCGASQDGERGGAVKLDDASLTPGTDGH